MLGNPVSKSLRLGGWLLSHPNYIFRYVRTAKSVPIDIQTPWFSWPAIDFLEKEISSASSVFEYGSGGSTLFFSQRAAHVRSVEDNRHWFDLLQQTLGASGISNVDYLFASSTVHSSRTYADSDFVRALNKPFDIVIIDGSEEWPDEIVRPHCFEHAQDYVSPGGMIVLDDAWRYDGKIGHHRAKKIHRFQGVGPGRFGVTRTDVYCY